MCGRLMRACAPLMTGPRVVLHPYSLSPIPQGIKLPSGARTSSMAFGSAPWASRSSIAATWPFFAAKWKAVVRNCEGARKGTRHSGCSEHETRAPQHRRARQGVTSVGSGRGTLQQGLGYKLLCQQPGREQVVWACCRNSTPWYSNALKLGKQHRTGALSRSLNSPPGRPGSLY